MFWCATQKCLCEGVSILGSEKCFENKIKKYLTYKGAYFVKFFANRMTKTGVPDILACVNGYFVGIEVKAQTGKPSPLQIHNVEEIKKAGGFAFIVYPSGWDQLKKFIDDLSKETFSEEFNKQIILK